ncbi:MAG TPA: ATP synthase F1 subunit gamma [Chthoniobacterales bacterium]|nr:ATP synthase F1 subunit gamma [Chthoniobacterales bacterium]
MPSTRDIRRRIKSVKNTAQITKAMQMVAASKMRKAQTLALAGHPYAQLLNRMLVSLHGKVNPTVHPLLEEREVKKELVLVVSTDKGLCGGLNTNLFREISKYDASKTDFVSIGRKGKQFIARTKRNLLADFELADRPSFLEVKSVSKFLVEKFLNKDVDKVTILFSRFVNTLNQEPRAATLLPLAALPVNKDLEEQKDDGAQFIFEPDEEKVLDALLPYYIHYGAYQAVLDARASEHSARMVAMKNATDNAKTLVKDLTLEYNKVRQAAITSELLEITTAQMALS